MVGFFEFINVYLAIKRSGLFDKKYYIFQYPDVREQDIDPIRHYILFGAKELRDPSHYFSTSYYLKENSDVLKSGINPLYHYIEFGYKESRNPSDVFNTKYYLDMNEDVARSGVNPLYHYIRYGKSEKRKPVPEDMLLSSFIFEKKRNNRVSKNNRILIYFHNNKQNLVSEHILFTLDKINCIFSNIIVVSSSLINEEDRKKVASYCDVLLLTKYTESDFTAWREAILHKGFDCIRSYNSLTLMNDKCFGPMRDLMPVYEEMEQKEIDIWGEEKLEHSSYKSKNSSSECLLGMLDNFLVLGKRIIQSPEFECFWKGLSLVDDDLKSYSETKNNFLATFSKFKVSGFVEPDLANFSLHKTVFVQISSFLESHHPTYYFNLVENTYGDVYDSNLMKQHFNSVLEPNQSSKILNKNLLVTNLEHNVSYKVAVHIHVFYLDVFVRILDSFLGKNYINIYVTTYSNEIKSEIAKTLIDKGLDKFKDNIYVFENKGRDILPWIKLSSILEAYDVVGHFHTKKSKFYNESWFGDSWMDEILDTIATPSDEIIKEFESNNELGIVIPEIPYFFKFLMRACPFDGSSGQNRENIQKLWSKLGVRKNCDFTTLNTPIMPYGTMFWYRPEALRKLIEYPCLEKDIPSEPLGRDGTVLHAIERMPVYIAWSEGYDYRVALTKKSISSGFDYKSNSKG